jgi:hypothetical protein
VAGAVSFCLVTMGLTFPGPHSARAGTHMRVQTSAEPEPRPAGDHFLRDSIPATVTASAPPDTTDDDFVLPEEKDKKTITKEIVLFVFIAAFVAYFIVKVFIEKDNSSSNGGSNGKPITPPQ